jgi:hypothetical protein
MGNRHLPLPPRQPDLQRGRQATLH